MDTARNGCRDVGQLLDITCLSLRAKPFLLVLGRGETDLAALGRLFAKRIGATGENGRYLQLQVPVDWMDSSDLFGHLDLQGRFVPGPVLDFLTRARRDPEKPYLLCLDRIGLSRAEYYLRELLSSLEDRTPLVPEIYYGRDDRALQTYGRIPYLPNLYVIGTSNLDQASLPLNQKLLDRVHTIYLQQPLAETALPAEEKDNGYLKGRYSTVEDHLEKAREYFPLFAQLNTLLMGANAYLGYRMRNDAILFLLNNDLLPRPEAEDHMLCQKVLTRLQGGRKLQPVLAQLEDFCRDRYPVATEQLRRMARQLREEDYTSYWS